MSVTPSDPDPQSEQDDIATIREINSDPDDMLERLVSLVNGAGGSIDIGVTVLTGGLLVTGQLVAGRAWFEAVAEATRFAAEPESPEGIVAALFADMYQGKADTYARPLNDRDGHEEEDDEYTRIAFLHLKDAQTVVHGGMRINLGLWRVRLSHVDGWTPGKFTF